MNESTEEAIARVHAESAERGRALLALAAEHNDVGGPEEPQLTIMSAIVDMLHASADLAAADGGYPAEELLRMAQRHYEMDQEGTW